MKNLLLASIISVTATTAVATDFSVTGTVTSVVPRYSQQAVQEPREFCRNVQTSQGGNAGSNALGGMIVGGIIGKAITGDDSGAAAGAIMGGIIGADKSQPPSTVTKRVCETTYVTVMKTKTTYDVYYDWNGFDGLFTTRTPHSVGQRVPLTLTLKRF